MFIAVLTPMLVIFGSQSTPGDFMSVILTEGDGERLDSHLPNGNTGITTSLLIPEYESYASCYQ